VLARLRVRRRAGSCNGYPATLTAVQRDILKQLKAKAFEVGGNAVIYANSALGTETHDMSVAEGECRGGAMMDNFGSGWVVIMNAKTPPPRPAADTHSI
jgi:hypothetical protein